MQQHILVSVNPKNACDPPPYYLGSLCDVIDVDTRLDLTTVAVWDNYTKTNTILQVDSHCVEKL